MWSKLRAIACTMLKALRKNICRILVPRDISHRQFAISDDISVEIIAHVEVFNAGMKNWILDHFQGTFRICIDHENRWSSCDF